MYVKSTSGYSEATKDKYIPSDVVNKVINLSTEIEPVFKYEDGKRTEEVIGCRLLCGMPNDTFKVKFDHEVKVPAYAAKVKFTNLVACEVGNNVYFKADDWKEG